MQGFNPEASLVSHALGKGLLLSLQDDFSRKMNMESSCISVIDEVENWLRHGPRVC